MDPPAKRLRVDASWPDDTDDELAFDPFQLPEEEGITSEDEFERAAHETSHRFQSAMASIFERYGRDFEGIGDEVDLMTEDVVVDNGHLSGMRSEHDTGLPDYSDGEEEGEGGLRLCDLLDVSLLDDPQRSHTRGDMDDDATAQSVGSRGGAVADTVDVAAEESKATTASLKSLAITPSGDTRNSNGDISPARATANKARLQSRRSPTPTGFASSVWRLDDTPPKRSARGAKSQQSRKAATNTRERRHSEPSKAITCPVTSKITPPKRPVGKRRKTLEAASGNVGSLEIRSTQTDDDSVPEQDSTAERLTESCPRSKRIDQIGMTQDVSGRRRSSRPSIPVDYLGKITWKEVAVQQRSARGNASLKPNCSPEPIRRPGGKHNKKPLANMSSKAPTIGPERVIADSQETHIPSSGEISSSTRASQPSQVSQNQQTQAAGAGGAKPVLDKEHDWEKIFDLSDDEMPMPLPASRARPAPSVVVPESPRVAEHVSEQSPGVVCRDSMELDQAAVVEEQALSPQHEADDEAVLESERGPSTKGGEQVEGDRDSAAADEPESADVSMDDALPGSDVASSEAQPQKLAQSPENRDASPDLGTPSHGRTLPPEIPESPNYADTFPSSSPVKLSSPMKRPLPIEEPELPSPQPSSRQSPQRRDLGMNNYQTSSPSTNRATRLQNHRQTQSPSGLTKSPIKTYARSPSSRSIWDPRRSPPRATTTTTTSNTSPKKSSPLKKTSSKPSTPKTPSFRTTRKIATPSSRNSLLSFTGDRDDVDELSEVIGQGGQQQPLRRRGTISGRIAQGASTPKSTGRKTRLPYRPRMSMGAKASDMAEVVQSPGGTLRECGKDGFICDRDFCFTCL